MKNIKYLLIGLVAFTMSCENAYDFDRGFLIEADGAINNLTDAERLIVGSYELVPTSSIVEYNAYAGDNLKIGNGNRGQGIQAHSFQMDSTDDLPTALWRNAYNVIDQVNRVIVEIQRVAVAGEEDRRDQLLAEAYALRGWMHFELFRAYTPVYDNPASPSAIVVNRVILFDPNNIVYLGRNTAGEMLTQINADFALAESLIDATADNKYRMTQAAIDGFQARLGLYENTPASLASAVANATAALTLVGVSGQPEYDAMFREDALDTEVIFSIEKDVTDGAIGTLFTDTNNDVFFEVSDDLVFGTGGVLASSNTDVRFPLILDFETVISDPEVSGTDFPVGKYVGRSRANQALHDHKILRASEMLLIRAEANAKIDGNDADGDAAADITLIRAARGSAVGTPANYPNLNDALADIQRERRLELAFEGHRVYDLKRNNTDIVRLPADCAGLATPCGLAISTGRFTMPLPQAEIDANNAILESDQNPGY